MVGAVEESKMVNRKMFGCFTGLEKMLTWQFF